jgi:hypothetical protein
MRGVAILQGRLCSLADQLRLRKPPLQTGRETEPLPIVSGNLHYGFQQSDCAVPPESSPTR